MLSVANSSSKATEAIAAIDRENAMPLVSLHEPKRNVQQPRTQRLQQLMGCAMKPSGYSDTPKPRRPSVADRDRPLFDAGIKEGREQMQKLALSFLQAQYMDPEVARNSPEGQAIIKVATDLSAYLKEMK